MAERPEYWRYWRDLPPKGRMGIFLRCWYSQPILDRVNGRTTEAEFDEALDRIIAFERELADDGALILKFWMHLGRKAQKERLTKLEDNPLTRWRVSPTDWDHWHLYDKFIGTAERVIRRTSIGHASWQIVEGEDKRYRTLTVAKAISGDAVRAHLEQTELHRRVIGELKARSDASSDALQTPRQADEALAESKIVQLPNITVLSRLDVSRTIDAKIYDQAQEEFQGKLNLAVRKAKDLGVSSILVFEGWDAAGKGGAIRRIVGALDARDYGVIPIAAPTEEEERARHYLWRVLAASFPPGG
ncbi:MAG: hypothetical protein U1E35_04315 [Rhodospirillales bacterium]